MIEDVVKRVSKARDARAGDAGSESLAGAAKPALDDEIGIGRIMSAIEDGDFSDSELAMLRKQWQSTPQSPPPHPPPPPICTPGPRGPGQSSFPPKPPPPFPPRRPPIRLALPPGSRTPPSDTPTKNTTSLDPPTP